MMLYLVAFIVAGALSSSLASPAVSRENNHKWIVTPNEKQARIESREITEDGKAKVARDITPPTCSGHSVGDYGSMGTPFADDGFYLNNMYCEWTIHTTSNSLVISVYNMEIEQCGENCDCDRLMIIDRSNTHTLCGYIYNPVEINVSGRQIKIRFVTDSSMRYWGFSLDWYPLPVLATAPWGTPEWTTPPGTTPSGTTPSGTTPSGTTPSGTTPSGTTPSGTTPSGTTPSGTTPSGTTPSGTTTSGSSCDMNYYGDTGVVTSPGYGNGTFYSNYLDCETVITGRTRLPLTLRFVTLDLEVCNGASCTCDYVQVFTEQNSTTSPQYCSDTNGTFRSAESYIRIVFHSDVSLTDVGFMAEWYIDPADRPPCGDTEFTENSGTLVHPEQGSYYLHGTICEWTISPIQGSGTVRLHFVRVDIELADACRWDKLEIWSNGSSAATSVICGTSLPDDIIAFSPVRIIFTSDSSVAKTGFEIEWSTEPEVATTPSPPVPPPVNITSGCGIPAIRPNSMNRVYGGEEALPNSWPWQVSLWHVNSADANHSDHHMCGGTIVDNQWILTAAHCVVHGNAVLNVSTVNVWVGEHNLSTTSGLESEHAVQEIHVNANGDIALLKLETPLVYSDEVSPVCLAEMTIDDDVRCIVSGWGQTEDPQNPYPDVLQQAPLLTITQATCSGWYDAILTEPGHVDQTMLCAGFAEGGQSPCFGDSGGPLVCEHDNVWRQHGIVSWGVVCAAPEQPAVFTRVSVFTSWIYDTIGAGLPVEGGECGGVANLMVLLDSASGEISSPGFSLGENYPDDSECAWEIIVSPNMTMVLHFENFTLESFPPCIYDWLQVHDGDMTAPSVRYCGNTLPNDTTSSGNTMLLVFRSDHSVHFSGFRLTYQEITPVQPPENIFSGPTCGTQVFTPRSSRIVGGVEAAAHSWPWQISMQYFSGFHFCGGSIVARQWILTAAHCVDGKQPSGFRVVTGEHDRGTVGGTEQTFDVEEIFMHESYANLDNDIALLKLNGWISFDNWTIPVCVTTDTVEPPKQCMTTGWGSTENISQSNMVLNQVSVPIVEQFACQGSYTGSTPVTDNMVCAGYAAGGMDSCQGDSGGPLVCHEHNVWFQHGVTSWGRGCALANYPGVYTRLSKYILWMFENSGGAIRPSTA